MPIHLCMHPRPGSISNGSRTFFCFNQAKPLVVSGGNLSYHLKFGLSCP
nr:MAG TPA: hypothetical protein [Microviridae sp.]